MRKNYYIVLGVPRGASNQRIKRAYRDMAKRYHPDSGGEEISENKFRELQTAYETLSDVHRRAAYDNRLAQRLRSSSPPIRKNRYQANPSVSNISSKTAYSAIDDFFDGWVVGKRATGRRDLARDIAIEIILTPDEAQHGGLFPLTLPVLEPCMNCGHSGLRFPFTCSKCRGRGYRQAERHFSISIPPNTKNRTEVSVPLDGIGLEGFYLYVFIRIEEADLW